MDVQFSGAVDFSPLFEQMGKPKPPAARKPSGVESGGSMLEEQQALMKTLNQANDWLVDEAAGTGRFVNLIA